MAPTRDDKHHKSTKRARKAQTEKNRLAGALRKTQRLFKSTSLAGGSSQRTAKAAARKMEAELAERKKEKNELGAVAREAWAVLGALEKEQEQEGEGEKEVEETAEKMEKMNLSE